MCAGPTGIAIWQSLVVWVCASSLAEGLPFPFRWFFASPLGPDLSFLPVCERSSTVQASHVETNLGGKTLRIETGKLAKQAHGAVVVQFGDTVTLVTAVEGEEDERRDFFPLVVDYREKTYAAGKFPGGFTKAQGRPTTKEILTSRLMNSPSRQRFP